MQPSHEDFWVFGYGSLVWRPGFEFLERRLATVRGYHRSLCIYSHVHRGTPEKPGLVLGLDRGGTCRGVAFRVAKENQAETLAYLRAREQATQVYREVYLRTRLDDGRTIAALTYVADRRHPQYAGRLPRSELLKLVNQGIGISGENPGYITNTHDHLNALGIRDETLHWLNKHLAQN